MHGNAWVDAAIGAILRMAAERSGRLVAVCVALPDHLHASEAQALAQALHRAGHHGVAVEVVAGQHPRLVSAEFER